MSGIGEAGLGEEAALRQHVRGVLMRLEDGWPDELDAIVERIVDSEPARDLVAQARADGELQATRETWRKAHAARDEMVADFMARIEKARADGAAEEREQIAREKRPARLSDIVGIEEAARLAREEHEREQAAQRTRARRRRGTS